MLMSLLSHLLCAWFAFLLPSYATFKALAQRPPSEPELQRWATYWSVVGVFVALEYCAEWLISWLPFYWEAKTLFLLYCALPQTQGSTYIYSNFLQPFFAQHEAELDEGIIQVQKNVLSFVQTRLTALWEYILGAANKRQSTSTSTTGTSSSPATNGTAGAPAAFSLQSAYTLWQTYGTSIMNTLGSKGATSASSTSVQSASTAATQRRAQDDNRDQSNASPPPSNPPFPEPQHFSS